MLCYNVRDLEQQAARVEGWLAADDGVWQAGDSLPSEPLHVTGRLSKAGTGRFYWQGRVEGTTALPCRRCLVDVRVKVAEDVHLIFADSDSDEAEDPDVFRLPRRAAVVDLRPAIREQWLLSAPAFALCREECKGLCARCGADLNAGPCECPPAVDGRWEALRAVRRDAE
jgi:uncharacterized protein